MERSIALFYFSGTGNTEIIARLFAESMRNAGNKVLLRRIEDADPARSGEEVKGFDLVGIGFPVLGFDAPRNVRRFVKTLPFVSGREFFIFSTACDSIAINFAASRTLRHMLSRRGLSVFHESLLAMPCNFLVKMDDRFSQKLCREAKARVSTIAEEVLSGQERVLRVRSWLWALARMIGGVEDLGARCFGKDLVVKKTCTQCLRCVRECPTQNIFLEREKIKFGWDCVLCMRCIYSCPARAIVPQLQRAFVLKDGYDIRRIWDKAQQDT